MSLRISVVIPFYNTPIEYFKECLESVMKLHPHEIIIVDDCSTDEKLIQYARSLPCKYFKTPFQSGFDGLPFNLGVQKASGTYICRVDSDDILIELPNQMRYDIHFGNADRVYITDDLSVEDLILAPRAIFNAIVIKKELLLKHTLAEDANVYGDVLLVLQLLHNKYPFDIHPTVNYIYNKRPNSVQTSQTKFQHRLRHIQTVSRFCFLENIDPALSFKYLNMAMLNLRYGSKSRKFFIKQKN